MPAFIDLTGHRYNHLTVISRAASTKRSKWNCLCDCGNAVIVLSYNLRGGHTKSCGCAARTGDIPITDHELFGVWSNMKRRCYGVNSDTYKNYGARGITVCRKWRESFWNFVESMPPRPPGYTIERIDNNAEYSPSNCKWATVSEQNFNKRTNNMVTYNGKTLSITQWGRESGINYMTIYQRIERGWSVADALTIKPHK